MFRKIYITLALLTALAVTSKASVLSPQPTCISVLPNGNITIRWLTPADPLAQFVSYTIYKSSSAGGPFTAVGAPITTYLTISYTDITANGNLAPVYYYIQTTYNAGGIATSAPLDTMESIHLTATNPLSGTAILTWNAIHTPPLATTATTYNIYQEFPTGVWTLTGSTSNLNFIDTIFICSAHINYRVEIADNTGCVSVSSVDGGNFSNLIFPSTPLQDTLSVNNANQAMLSWNVNPASDASGYVIYFDIGGGVFVPIDTVYGRNTTSYLNLLSLAGNSSETYRIAALDSCNNISPMSASLTTIFVTTTPNICAHLVTLSWNAYPTIGTGLAGYKIWRSATSAAGPYALIGTVAAGVLSFNAGSMTTGNTYYYNVEAFDVSLHKLASSNRVNYLCPTPIPPNFLYLVSVSVSGTNRVDVTAFVDTAASVLGYKIMRADAYNPTSFAQVGFVSSSTAPLFIYSDYDTDTDTKSYLYKVVAIDSCGFDGLNSNTSQTILLTVQGNKDNTNTVSWNKYSSWGGRVANFNVYRGLDSYIPNIPIITTDSLILDDTTLYDDVWPELKGDGNFYYQIKAIEGTTNPLGFSAVSLSNIAIAKQELEYFIPNAFVPDAGVNVMWKPVIKWVAYYNYELNIFNRIGENIYYTRSYEKGWDGTYNGGKCESGVYIYTLKFNNAVGDTFQKNGTITLIR